MPGPAHEVIPAALVEGVELLSLDAGNTVIFLDHARLARLLGAAGVRGVSAEALVDAEGVAKRLHHAGGLPTVTFEGAEEPGAQGWGGMVSATMEAAGVDVADHPRLLSGLWQEHTRLNLWSLVPPGLGQALDEVRAAGVKVVIVSNSEGMLEGLFRRLGIREHFDALLDSGTLGVEKPDPRIFRAALDPFGVAPHGALHLGDSMATDIAGARAAGLRSALIDPYEHWKGLFGDVSRVPDVATVARTLTARMLKVRDGRP